MSLHTGGSASDPRALGPEVTAAELAQLATERPDLWPEIWQHPNCYDGLRQWMADRAWAPQGGAGPDPAQTSVPESAVAGLATYADLPSDLSAAATGPTGPAPAAALTPDALDAQGGPVTYSPSTAATGSEQKPRRTALIVIAAVLIVALALGGGVAALSLTGSLDRWFGGGGSEATTAAKAQDLGPSFADGLERMWVADSNDFATPRVGELGQDFSSLWWPFSRGSIALFQSGKPVASSSAVVFTAQGEDTHVVMLDRRTGDTILDRKTDSMADCVVDTGVGADVGAGADSRTHADERFLCVFSHDQRGETTLLQIDPQGTVEEFTFDGAMHRVAVDDERIILASDHGAALALDREMQPLWQHDDLANGGYAGLDLGGELTLVRGFNGWTLLGASGETLASAAVVSPYDGGDGACDARLTPSGKLFVAGNDACVQVEDDGLDWWGFGPNLSGTHFFSVDGRDYLLTGDEGGVELRRFPEITGKLESVFASPVSGVVAGVTRGEEPSVVLVGVNTATTLALNDGREIASWPVTQQDNRRFGDGSPSTSSRSVMLDGDGVVLIEGRAYDSATGAELWKVDASDGPIAGWMSPAGLLVLGGGCPECSNAGGYGSSSTLTLYAPADSGGTLVSASTTAGSSSTATIEAPDFIPSCPGSTVLLAWAEVSDGWIVVCGYDATTPSYVALQLPGQKSPVISLGGAKPTSAEAQAAVTWDEATHRYRAQLADGRTVVLDGDYGTVTVRDGRTVTSQHQMIRYVFVPLGTKVRTNADSASGTGAYGVKHPEATAEDQIRFMIEVLEKAYEGRALVKEALPSLAGCTLPAGGYGGVVAAMEAVRDNRAELLAMLDGMPVDKIPEGAQLLDDLTEAIAQSHAANVEYVAWAQAANASGCAALSATGQAAAAASDAPKERFAARWNRAVAPAYGVRTFDSWYI